MLSDFFRINLPYGIAKNEDGQWMAFNREYMPLGYNNEKHKGSPGQSYLGLPIYTKYKRVSEKLLLEIAHDESGIQRDEEGNIATVFLYNDGNNPMNQSREKEELWNDYFTKLKKLAKLKT